jgi:hypothetical protein
MPTETPISPDDPRMTAWEKYKTTEDYANSVRWAGYDDNATAGSLWAAFLKGHTVAMEAPIDMLLYCPHCAEQHVDLPQPEKGWDNPPHRSHECQACGWVWRPADMPTNGVAAIKTKGKLDKGTQPKRLFESD